MFIHSHSLTHSILVASGRHLETAGRKEPVWLPVVWSSCPRGSERRALGRNSSRKGRSHPTFFSALGMGAAQQRWAEDGLLDKTGFFPGQKQCKKMYIRALMGRCGARTSSVCLT